VFESGMSAITTVLLEFLSPGDVLLYSNPIYGGTDHFIKQVLTRFGIEVMGFYPWEQDLEEIVRKSGKADRIRMIYVETPANPTNILIDIQACSRFGEDLQHCGKAGASGGGQHLHGAAVAASVEARRGSGALLGHQVHRRPQRCDRGCLLGQRTR
jgi:hypothetical protein